MFESHPQNNSKTAPEHAQTSFLIIFDDIMKNTKTKIWLLKIHCLTEFQAFYLNSKYFQRNRLIFKNFVTLFFCIQEAPRRTGQNCLKSCLFTYFLIELSKRIFEISKIFMIFSYKSWNYSYFLLNLKQNDLKKCLKTWYVPEIMKKNEFWNFASTVL